MTVSGKTYAENLKIAKPADGEVIKTYDKPMLGRRASPCCRATCSIRRS
jgi:hypothetical protein